MRNNRIGKHLDCVGRNQWIMCAHAMANTQDKTLKKKKRLETQSSSVPADKTVGKSLKLFEYQCPNLMTAG